MLRKVLKWVGIVIGSVVVLLLVFYAVVYFQTESRANKVYDVKLQTLVIPDDSASYALGKHIAGIRGCMDCHTADLSGGVFADDSSPLGTLYASNLTSGKGGIKYSDQDWIRALRHGLNRENKSLWFMPAQEVSYQLSNRELGALICYVKKQPPVDKTHPGKEIRPLGRFLTFLGEFPMFPAEAIDHTAIPPEEVTVSVTPEYGKYVATTCLGCHGANLKGGPNHTPGAPPIADLSPTGRLPKWTADGFVTAMRTGKTPEGRLLDDTMPWKSIGKTYTDDELKAVFLYLRESK